MPNAFFIGCTGTPTKKADAHTRAMASPSKALVAFTDVVKDAKDGREYTEAKMNDFPEAATGGRFEGDEYRSLIVASKFHTGFDQPKLVAMVVDKKLNGVSKARDFVKLYSFLSHLVLLRDAGLEKLYQALGGGLGQSTTCPSAGRSSPE